MSEQHASEWYNAFIAILFVSTLPNFLLLLIPTQHLIASTEDKAIVGINYQSLMLSFSAAGLIGDVFIHTLPHLLSSDGDGSHEHHNHEQHRNEKGEGNHNINHAVLGIDRTMLISLTLIFGFLAFLTVERVSSCSHAHNHKIDGGMVDEQHEPQTGAVASGSDSDNSSSLFRRNKGTTIKIASREAKESHSDGANHLHVDVGKHNDSLWPLLEALRKLHVTGWLNLIADSLHNFTDGIAIGASFASGRGLAYATFLSVIIHEIPHELGDFAILLQNGLTKHQAIQAQFVTAIAAFAGTSVGLMSKHYHDDAEDYLLAFTAGGFLYLATVTILGSRQKSSHQETFMQVALEVFCFVVGIALMVVVAILE